MFAEAIGGIRISRTGEPGPDVEGPDGRLYEIKLLRSLPALLRSWIEQKEREGAVAVGFKEDRGEWFILTTLREWMGADEAR